MYNILKQMMYQHKVKVILGCVMMAMLTPFYGFSQESKDSVRIDLNKALEIALSDNPTIKIADRDIQIQKNYKKEQIVPLFPDVSGSASYSRTLQKQVMVMEMGGQNMEIEVGTSNNWNAGLSASLPVIAPAAWFNVKLSQLNVESAIESARSSKISLVNEVKKAYYGYLFAKDSHRVLLLNYENVLMNLEDVIHKYENGLTSEFEKL
ncbi:TolC family protein, partial [Bacteroidales bacterium OttesenSCG-928-L19]|nr:TolC family protein [Bacteroidales bacterium OttesenSCG-928-L19]